ncbi:MAG: ribosomal-processing cysteine protease Prp [Clostridiales bacterium]|nr:ribosomal-processing cysteine protease Prp [Clostridiales bacterium]
MITIEKYYNDHEKLCGFHTDGHAEFADAGEDVVCAAVSALVLNAVNSIESFTEDHIVCTASEDGGRIDFRIHSSVSHESEILLNSLFLGLEAVRDAYGEQYGREFIHII